jgi:hypothetical protein
MQRAMEGHEVNAAGAPPGAGASAGMIRRLGELSTESREFAAAAGGVVTDAVSGWVAGQYVDAGREKLAEADPAERCEIMRGFAREWWLLRRGDLLFGRLQLDREAQELRRADNQVRKEKEFREWLNSPKMQAGLHTNRKRGLSEETLRRIEEAMKII